MGGGGLLGLSVPGAAALPFAPAAAVRAALLQLCTQPQMAAPSSSDAATQVRGVCEMSFSRRAEVDTQRMTGHVKSWQPRKRLTLRSLVLEWTFPSLATRVEAVWLPSAQHQAAALCPTARRCPECS